MPQIGHCRGHRSCGGVCHESRAFPRSSEYIEISSCHVFLLGVATVELGMCYPSVETYFGSCGTLGAERVAYSISQSIHCDLMLQNPTCHY
jgi:hypothetical protein